LSVLVGDCVEVMAGMEPDSVDAIVCDPPYMLRFMGKSWDSPTSMSGHRDETVPEVGRGSGHDHGHDNWRPDLMGQWHAQWATAALRVAKPGAYLLAFGGTRTVHRMTCALEDAGWVIRDMLVWAYAQGFPKSKASLKPAWEPIVMARKPGASRDLNIDAARIGIDPAQEGGNLNRMGKDYPSGGDTEHVYGDGRGFRADMPTTRFYEPAGRWPANVILTDPILDGGWDGVVGGGEQSGGNLRNSAASPTGNGLTHGAMAGLGGERGYGDSGTASRFFMLPQNETKAAEADARLHVSGCPGIDWQSDASHGSWVDCGCPKADTPAERPDAPRFLMLPKAPTRERVLSDGRRSPHPTQKPEALIRHLVTLVTPDGGLVLDPFLGSGTLGVVCDGLGVRWLGIEREPEYAQWAEDRIRDRQPEWSVA
jgi:DNA modification methylase